MRRTLWLMLVLLIASVLLAACSGGSEEDATGLKMASMDEMPAKVQEAPSLSSKPTSSPSPIQS